jgi:uncharacterized protein (TIGR00297 family)
VSIYSETRRQIVHVAMAGFALLLPYLTWPQAAALAGAALVFNASMLARVAPRIVRNSDRVGARAGLLFYPLSVLALILLFPRRLDIVAAAWGILAFGDGFATIAGQEIGGARLPWNREKTWSGLAAFTIAGSAAGVALSVWVAPSIDPLPVRTFTIWAPIGAAIVAAFVETLPIGLDDNLSVPAAAGGALWFASQLDWIGPVDALALDLLIGMALSAPLAFAARWAVSVTTGGAIVGSLLGAVIYAAFFLAGMAVLGLALVLTIASSRAGRARKAAIGEHGERRGAGNIVANCAVGTLGAALELFNFTWGLELTAVWFVAGIAAGASDTVASEIGKAYGGRPRTFPTWRPAAVGTPGAVSIAGTIAGVTGATLIALPAAAMWLLPLAWVGPVVVACTAGAFVESALATKLEGPGVLDNNTLNFINTAVAAAVAVWWCA